MLEIGNVLGLSKNCIVFTQSARILRRLADEGLSLLPAAPDLVFAKEDPDAADRIPLIIIIGGDREEAEKFLKNRFPRCRASLFYSQDVCDCLEMSGSLESRIGEDGEKIGRVAAEFGLKPYWLR